MTDPSASRRSNRRLTARTTCHLTVHYHATGAWRPATAMDLSRHGCRLRLGEDLARACAVSVRFENTPREGQEVLSVEVDGRVIWSRFEGLSHQVGVQFTELPPGLDQILSAIA